MPAQHQHGLQVRRAFADWMRQIMERLVPSGFELPPIRKLEDVSMTFGRTSARMVTDTERLADVGDWLVQCDTGAGWRERRRRRELGRHLSQIGVAAGSIRLAGRC